MVVTCRRQWQIDAISVPCLLKINLMSANMMSKNDDDDDDDDDDIAKRTT